MTKSKEDLLSFLQGHHLAGLATITPANQAHATSIFYFVDENLYLYFVTKNSTKKYQFLRQNPLVGIEIVDEQVRQTVQLEGSAREIVDSAEFSQIVDRFQAEIRRNPRIWSDLPITHIKDGYCIFAVHPSWLCWSDFHQWEEVKLLELTTWQ